MKLHQDYPLDNGFRFLNLLNLTAPVFAKELIIHLDWARKGRRYGGEDYEFKFMLIGGLRAMGIHVPSSLIVEGVQEITPRWSRDPNLTPPNTIMTLDYQKLFDVLIQHPMVQVYQI